MSESLQEDLLIAGIGDWVHFGEVAWLAARRGAGRGREDQIAVALSALRDLQERGLMEVGDVGPEGFAAWRLPVNEVEERVRTAWLTLDRDPVPGDIGWLANTALGDRVADEWRDRDA